MLFWEALNASAEHPNTSPANGNSLTVRTRRLPYDKRCIALTKSGTRCRGRIRQGTDFCPFHDPELTAERRRRLAARGGRTRRRLSHLPDGYLRKLTSQAAIGQAMDRLYREVRLGTVSLEMGVVLFRILARLLDSDLIDNGRCPKRSKAARIRPRLQELLTPDELAAWQKATTNAALSSPDMKPEAAPTTPFERAVVQRRKPQETVTSPATRTLQAAS